MMSDKLSAILAGESFPSSEIQNLIGEIEKDQTEARGTLETLKKSIEEKRLGCLGKLIPKEVKVMETEAAELQSLTVTMGQALERLQDALEKALDSETTDTIREIDEQISALEAQKQGLLPEFFEVSAKAFSLYLQLFANRELTISQYPGPIRFWPRESQIEFHDHLEEFGAGKKIIPHEIQSLQSRRKFLTTRT